MLMGYRKENIHQIDLYASTNLSIKCFMSKEEETWFWHRIMAHTDKKNIEKLSKRKLV